MTIVGRSIWLGALLLIGSLVSSCATPPRLGEQVWEVKTFFVFFDYNSATLSAEAKEVVAEVAHAAKGGAARSIQFVAHSDSVGSFAYQRKSAKLRTASIEAELLRLGISVDAIHIALLSRGPELDPMPPAPPPGHILICEDRLCGEQITCDGPCELIKLTFDLAELTDASKGEISEKVGLLKDGVGLVLTAQIDRTIALKPRRQLAERLLAAVRAELIRHTVSPDVINVQMPVWYDGRIEHDSEAGWVLIRFS